MALFEQFPVVIIMNRSMLMFWIKTICLVVMSIATSGEHKCCHLVIKLVSLALPSNQLLGQLSISLAK